MLTIFQSLQLCNIIALVIICSVKAQHTRQNAPISPQENENIINTKDDIARLEGCHYTLTDGSDLMDPRGPDIDQKECDGKKVVDIINIVASKMIAKNREKLFKIAIDGIKNKESYLDIAAYIDTRMGDPKTQVWIVFVGTKKSFSGKSMAAVPEMLSFVIGEIMIEAFRIDGSPAGGSSAEATNPQAKQPFTGSPSIESSNFETEINQYVVKSLTRLKENEKSADKICSTLINQLGNNFRAKINPNAWSCAAGLNDKFSVKIADQSVPRLTISWGSSSIQIMREVEEAVKSLRLDSDVIKETRQKLDLVSVNNTELSPKQEKIMISIVKDGVKNSESYAGVARYIQRVAGATFAQRFHVSVGLDTQYWIFFWKTDPWLINLKINELRVLAYALC